MIYDEKESMVHVKFADGKLDFCTWITNLDFSDDRLQEAIDSWNGEGEAGVGCHFTLSSILDTAIDLYQMPAYNNAIDVAGKPMFDAMRAELAAMVARIDALEYENPT